MNAIEVARTQIRRALLAILCDTSSALNSLEQKPQRWEEAIKRDGAEILRSLTSAVCEYLRFTYIVNGQKEKMEELEKLREGAQQQCDLFELVMKIEKGEETPESAKKKWEEQK